jgi:hypothetical protein
MFPTFKKAILLHITLFLLSFASVQTTRAQEDEAPFISFLKFSAGIITAFSIHEGSHAVVGAITGTDMSWDIGDYNQPIAFTEDAKNDFNGFAINAAGLLSQLVGSEIILRNERIDKTQPFIQGMMAWNILNPILYAIDYWFIHQTNKECNGRYQGDIEGLEFYANEPTAHGFALSIFGIAAYQGYRFLKTQSWAPTWTKNDAHEIAIAPISSGGMMITYRHPF